MMASSSARLTVVGARAREGLVLMAGWLLVEYAASLRFYSSVWPGPVADLGAIRAVLPRIALIERLSRHFYQKTVTRA